MIDNLGKTDVNNETKKLFLGESSSGGSSCTSQSIMSRAIKLINGSLSHKHSKKRKHASLSQTWSRPFTKNLIVIDFQRSLSSVQTLDNYYNRDSHSHN